MDKKLNTIRTRPRFKLETDLNKKDFELNLKTELQKIAVTPEQAVWNLLKLEK